MQSARAIIQRCPYFRGVPPHTLHVISAHVDHVSVAQGTVICREGDPSHEAWLLGRGAIEVRKELDEHRYEVLSTLKAGTIFGHVALLDDQPRSASLVAAGMSNLVRIRINDFQALLARHDTPGRFFRRAIILALGDTLLAAARHVKDLTQGPESPELPEDPDRFLANLRDKLHGGT